LACTSEHAGLVSEGHSNNDINKSFEHNPVLGSQATERYRAATRREAHLLWLEWNASAKAWITMAPSGNSHQFDQSHDSDSDDALHFPQPAQWPAVGSERSQCMP
jgi:hypothetical protein